ncbi:aminoglycoside N-acetyltransferase AAC(2')-Ie [Gordonia spumicola]|uniref:Aminoglycoside N-acetyltransferase AAC(2')-Ie n=1 Tax=Gordonia spumicola TaxID=589161 RepID=A0A7I9VDU1_9ACTN|nr:GNAT family N-acetyltransferase [Gordonia spumicola]GEE03382.1 aminoglycoside N-acetyltransferase AAC(2')-Ie [Gordonia spumicola]
MRLRHTHELSAEERSALLTFLYEAFDGDFADSDFDHALGGVHVFAEDESGIVGHASVVQRQMMVGDTVLRAGYVEAVAVAARMRRRGMGDTLMTHVYGIVVGAYDLGVLGASDDGMPLYLRRGWTPWTGPLGALTPDGLTMTPDDEGAILVLTTGLGADVDSSTRLVCDWRSGDLW